MWMFEDTLLSSLAVTLRDNVILSVSSLRRDSAILEEGDSSSSFLHYGLIFFKVVKRLSFVDKGESSLIAISKCSQYVVLWRDLIVRKYFFIGSWIDLKYQLI